jgi:hypothetical protein
VLRPHWRRGDRADDRPRQDALRALGDDDLARKLGAAYEKGKAQPREGDAPVEWENTFPEPVPDTAEALDLKRLTKSSRRWVMAAVNRFPSIGDESRRPNPWRSS